MSVRKRWFAGLAAAALVASVAGAASAEYLPEHRGGTLRLVARLAAGTVDPHINYTLQFWQIYQITHDGLVGFKKAAGAEGFKVVPNLAEAMPQVADGARLKRYGVRLAADWPFDPMFG